MQQNILLYSEAKTARPFWWSSLDFWVVWAFSRLTTSEDWPFRPLRGLKGQISGLSASLRPGQPRNLARQPKKSCCFSSLYNKIPVHSTYIKTGIKSRRDRDICSVAAFDECIDTIINHCLTPESFTYEAPGIHKDSLVLKFGEI